MVKLGWLGVYNGWVEKTRDSYFQVQECPLLSVPRGPTLPQLVSNLQARKPLAQEIPPPTPGLEWAL